jgi:hypothetical protein
MQAFLASGRKLLDYAPELNQSRRVGNLDPQRAIFGTGSRNIEFF